MNEYTLEHILSFTGLGGPAPEVIGPAPEGLRVTFHNAGGEVAGPRVNGKVRPVGGDWLTVRRDGVGVVDARLTFETHDGALILVTYGGVIDFGEDGYQNFLQGALPATARLRTTPASPPATPTTPGSTACNAWGSANTAPPHEPSAMTFTQFDNPIHASGRNRARPNLARTQSHASPASAFTLSNASFGVVVVSPFPTRSSSAQRSTHIEPRLVVDRPQLLQRHPLMPQNEYAFAPASTAICKRCSKGMSPGNISSSLEFSYRGEIQTINFSSIMQEVDNHTENNLCIRRYIICELLSVTINKCLEGACL